MLNACRSLRTLRSLLSLSIVGILVSCGGADDDDDGTEETQHCEDSLLGRWALGDGNLFLEVTDNCVVSNFCSIAEGIHTRGTATDTELRLNSVGGSPVTLSYVLSADTLTLIDIVGTTDLPLARSTASLPAACPAPP